MNAIPSDGPVSSGISCEDFNGNNTLKGINNVYTPKGIKPPFVLEKGRFRVIVSGDSLRIDDGSGGYLVLLTQDERKAISKALWYR